MTAVKSAVHIEQLARQRLPVPSVDVLQILEENKRLRDALEPFSEEAGWWLCNNYNASERLVEGFPGYEGKLTVGDLFSARAALKAQGT